MGSEKIRVTLNGKIFEFKKDMFLIDALLVAKIELPSPCRHKYLSNSSHCGLCAVGIRLNSFENWQLKLACTCTVSDGMEIDTEYQQAAKFRESAINLYLMKHPLDCSLCDKVGGCFLHKFASHTNFRGFTRVIAGHYFNRVLKKLGKRILIDQTKCIFCGRCLRFCREVLGEDILGKIKNEKNVDEIAPYPGKDCDSNYSLNLVDICPAGAIIDGNADSDHPTWGLHKTPSIFTESSVGINTYLLHDKKHVYRIIPRRNDYINEVWMTDSARNLVNLAHVSGRVTRVLHSGNPLDIRIAIACVASELINGSNGASYVVYSGEASVEDQFVLKHFLDSTHIIKPYFLKRKGKGDGFLVSDDPYPNSNGAIVTKLANESNTHKDLNDLYELVKEKKCSTIVCLYEDLFEDHIDSEIFNGVTIIYIGYKKNRTADVADFVFPVVTVFERTGTFVNKDFILQKFFKAVNPPKKDILECWAALSLIMNTYIGGEDASYLNLKEVWRDLPYVIEIFKEINFANIPREGIMLKKR